jgi:hypothetical protein
MASLSILHAIDFRNIVCIERRHVDDPDRVAYLFRETFSMEG